MTGNCELEHRSDGLFPRETGFKSQSRCVIVTSFRSLRYAQERLRWGEWAATAVAAAGTVLLGASTEDTPAGRQPVPNKARVALVLLSCVAGVGAVSLVRLGTYGHRRRTGPSARASAALFGLQARALPPWTSSQAHNARAGGICTVRMEAAAPLTADESSAC